ncbi:MAG: hypothetical protein HYT93_01730 [Parcubacteria group bacterium]|nr:hypothetical protein [Parcubacteria group bacterium]
MASWASKRRLLYTALVVGFFVLVISYPLYSFLHEPPSCFDGKQNQDETGIDCGGSCSLLCAFEVSDPIVLWSQSLNVALGVYDAVAYIENPNVSAGVRSASYSFKLYDDHGVLIAERIGTTFINPKERFVVFEGGIETGRRIPSRTFFEFITLPQWVDSIGSVNPLSIQNQIFTDAEKRPRLKAELVNNSLDAVHDIAVTALIFDKHNNVIAVSKTEVDRLTPQSSKTISFIWPQPILDEAIRIEITPRIRTVE